MDFRFNEEQQLWYDTLHNFMEKEVGREYTREHDASREFPEEVYKKMADQGWLGLMVPEEEGGVAADPIMFAIFCEAKGWHYIGEHLEYERLSIAASQVGNARTALDDTIRYTKERKQFGKTLSSFQVLKHRMAQNEAELSAARLMVYAAASKMARGERAMKEVTMAKLITSETLFRVAFNGMQALGGYAQLPEYDMERYFRESKHGMVGGGTNEILRSIIAKHMGL